MNPIDQPQPVTTHAGSQLRRSRRSSPPARGFRRTSFDLTASLKNALALVAAHEDRPMVAIVEEALALWMRQHGYEFEAEGAPVLADQLVPLRPAEISRDWNRPAPKA